MEMKQKIKTIAEQINYKELAFAKFKFVYDNNNLSLAVIKGQKTLVITYNEALDLYSVRKLKHIKFKTVQDETIDKIYCDQLQDIIQNFFKFEYVMKHIWRSG